MASQMRFPTRKHERAVNHVDLGVSFGVLQPLTFDPVGAAVLKLYVKHDVPKIDQPPKCFSGRDRLRHPIRHPYLPLPRNPVVGAQRFMNHRQRYTIQSDRVLHLLFGPSTRASFRSAASNPMSRTRPDAPIARGRMSPGPGDVVRRPSVTPQNKRCQWTRAPIGVEPLRRTTNGADATLAGLRIGAP